MEPRNYDPSLSHTDAAWRQVLKDGGGDQYRLKVLANLGKPNEGASWRSWVMGPNCIEIFAAVSKTAIPHRKDTDQRFRLIRASGFGPRYLECLHANLQSTSLAGDWLDFVNANSEILAAYKARYGNPERTVTEKPGRRSATPPAPDLALRILSSVPVNKAFEALDDKQRARILDRICEVIDHVDAQSAEAWIKKNGEVAYAARAYARRKGAKDGTFTPQRLMDLAPVPSAPEPVRERSAEYVALSPQERSRRRAEASKVLGGIPPDGFHWSPAAQKPVLGLVCKHLPMMTDANIRQWTELHKEISLAAKNYAIREKLDIPELLAIEFKPGSPEVVVAPSATARGLVMNKCDLRALKRFTDANINIDGLYNGHPTLAAQVKPAADILADLLNQAGLADTAHILMLDYVDRNSTPRVKRKLGKLRHEVTQSIRKIYTDKTEAKYLLQLVPPE